MAKKKTPEEIIVAYMQEKGIMYKWLSEQTEISQSHLCNILRTKGNNKKKLTEENKNLIAKVLGITLN
jgi:lambda repressor-like predicted transcriptional regulator